jgi:hypothetical protein
MQLEQAFWVNALQVSHILAAAGINHCNAVNARPKRTEKNAVIPRMASKVGHRAMAPPAIEFITVKLSWVKGHVVTNQWLIPSSNQVDCNLVLGGGAPPPASF